MMATNPIDQNSNIVPFSKGGWISGPARCLDCGHEWASVAPVGVKWLECPKCHLFWGRHTYPCSWAGKEVFECNCESHVFVVHRDGIYCAVCGDGPKTF